MKRDTVPFTAEVCFLLLIFGSIFALVLSGCGRPVDAAPAFTVEEAKPASCPCGAACECAALKAKIVEAERENEVNKAIVARLENNANVLAGEIDALKYAEPTPIYVYGVWYRDLDGEPQYYDAKASEWKARSTIAQHQATKPKTIYFQPMQGRRMRSCGPNGCPTM